MKPRTSTKAPRFREFLRRRYDALWSGALSRIRSGDVEIDPVLQAEVPDLRRGLTLMAQPSPRVQKAVTEFLHQLRQLEPGQHYYHPAEFHVTVLSLFTATVHCEPYFAQQQEYIAAVDAAVAAAEPLTFAFEGVTASPGTVMVQGFFVTDELDQLRNRLRQELQSRGLAHSVDQRYRLETAHMTVVRFRAPLRQAEPFARALEAAREQRFGTTTVSHLTLVQNDWYMSRSATRIIKRYRCGSGA